MLVRQFCDDQAMGRSGSRGKGAGVGRSSGRDYEALWQTRYKRARRQGMSEGMARYVARLEVHDQQLTDRGLRKVGVGDLDVVY